LVSLDYTPKKGGFLRECDLRHSEQRTVNRGQRTVNRGQRTEDRGQRTVDGRVSDQVRK
jgi:hypothetical protein